jgi:iron complex outermembrane receptor protein
MRHANQRASWIVGGILLAPLAGAATSDSTDQLQTIVVVGQKENLGIENAPEAITALTADALAQNWIESAEDLNGAVPGLLIGESDGYNFDLTIRGIGLNSPQDDGSPASVSLHQNGFFIPNPLSLSLGFLDLDHLEVLRGPQGTVFGQNSVGGTLNIITVQPTLDAVKGYVDGEFGSLDLEHFRGAINLPVSSTLALRFAGDFDKQKGYVTATAIPPGDYRLNDTNNYHVRLSALLQPNDDFSLLGSIEYAKVVQHEPESKNILDPNPDPREETSDWPGVYDIEQTIATLTATYNFSAMTFKSLSSLQYMNQGGSNSESGLTIPLATPIVRRRERPVRDAPELCGDPGVRLELEARRPRRLGRGCLLHPFARHRCVFAVPAQSPGAQCARHDRTAGPRRRSARGAGNRGRHAVFRDSECAPAHLGLRLRAGHVPCHG